MRRCGWTAAELAILAVVVVPIAHAAPPIAQIGTPLFSGANTGFEQISVGFGFAIPTMIPHGGSGVVGLTQQGALAQNIQFQAGGQPTIPFGLGPTTPGASFGYTVKSSLGTAFFGINASEGNDRGMMGQSASVTVMDGGTGFISDTSQSPFVTGIVPVVGDGGSSVLAERLQRLANGEGATTQAQLPQAPKAAGAAEHNPQAGKRPLDEAAAAGNAAAFDERLAAAQNAPAGEPVASLAEIRAQQAAEDQVANEEYRGKIQLAEAALAGGKPGVAKIYYGQVARHASGALKQQAIDALDALARKQSSPEDVSANTGSAR